MNLPRKRYLWKLQNLLGGYHSPVTSPRYWWTRNELIREVTDRALASPDNWEGLLRNPRFLHLCERIVEYSWLALRLREVARADSFLDVGCVCNIDYFLDFLMTRFNHIHFLNLVSEPLARHGRISYHSQDIRSHTLAPGSFDCITCISTLEHVAGNNSYNEGSQNGTAELAAEQGDWTVALPALFDLLKPDGRLFITTPYDDGKWTHGEYRFSRQDLERIEEMARQRLRPAKKWMMLKDADGWSVVDSVTSFDEARPVLPPGANRVVLWEFSGQESLNPRT